jgi:hypothetical protein
MPSLPFNGDPAVWISGAGESRRPGRPLPGLRRSAAGNLGQIERAWGWKGEAVVTDGGDLVETAAAVMYHFVKLTRKPYECID